MNHIKKLAVGFAFVLFLVLGMAATNPPNDEPKHKNLKVLSKKISHEELDKIMDGFKDALGVKCNFCHAPVADTSSHHLDFASDAKPEKEIARQMMRMTNKINKKYFSSNKDENEVIQPAVTCMTCHRHKPHPTGKN
jgi:hypothetical protein